MKTSWRQAAADRLEALINLDMQATSIDRSPKTWWSSPPFDAERKIAERGGIDAMYARSLENNPLMARLAKKDEAR